MEEGRRIKLWIMPEHVLSEITWGGKYTVESGIPEDARLLSIHYSVEHQGFHCVFEHDSFPVKSEHVHLKTEGWFRVIRGHGPRGRDALEQQVTELTDRAKHKWTDWLIGGIIGTALTVGAQFLITYLNGQG